MTDTPKLVGISGALRKASTNTLLVHEAARAFGPCDFTLGAIRFPLYDGDLEEAEGVPAEVMLLADQLLAADGVVISTPEYNKYLPGVLKNALDWLSRTERAPLAAKPVAIVSAAAGRAGGERSQFSLRHCLVPHGAVVIPGPEVMIAASGGAFDEAGHLRDPAGFEFLGKLMGNLRDEIALRA